MNDRYIANPFNLATEFYWFLILHGSAIKRSFTKVLQMEWDTIECKIVGIGSDGASVMRGSKNGVMAKLKQVQVAFAMQWLQISYHFFTYLCLRYLEFDIFIESISSRAFWQCLQITVALIEQIL